MSVHALREGLDSPQVIMARLAAIEDDLAVRQNALERAALGWFRAKRDREKARALAFLQAEGTVAERSAVADRDTATIGVEHEAEFESLKAVLRVMETRASIGQSLLRAQAVQ